MYDKVLLIILDQLRADFVFGDPAASIRLPNLQALASEGVSFQRHYTVTSPCAPSRASLLTGLYAMNHRAIRNGTPLARHHASLGPELRKMGVQPLLFGYADISADPTDHNPADPYLRVPEGKPPGFEDIVRMDYESQYSWRSWLQQRGYTVPEGPQAIYEPLDCESGEGSIRSPARYRAEDSDTAYLTDVVSRELSIRGELPWLAWVAYLRPHPPLIAPAPYHRMYASDRLPRPYCPHDPDRLSDHHRFFRGYFSAPQNRDMFYGYDGYAADLSDRATADLRAVYAGLITELDDHLGRLFADLKRSGLYDRTLIIVTADHGDMLGDHHQWGKLAMYDPALRIPLIIRDPRRRETAGGIVEAFTESIDIAPTILDWLGCRDIPRGFNGGSLLPFLDGGRPSNWRNYCYSEIDLGHPLAPTSFQRAMNLSHRETTYMMIRNERFNFVYFGGDVAPMLFDLEADPREGVDVASEPRFRDTVALFMRQMLDHRLRFTDHAVTDFVITSEGAKGSAR